MLGDVSRQACVKPVHSLCKGAAMLLLFLLLIYSVNVTELTADVDVMNELFHDFEDTAVLEDSQVLLVGVELK